MALELASGQPPISSSPPDHGSDPRHSDLVLVLKDQARKVLGPTGSFWEGFIKKKVGK